MRTMLLIFSIILSLNCYSQITKCEKEMIREVFTELVDEYKAECAKKNSLSYYDSSMSAIVHPYYIGSGKNMDTPTFEGFIEWLNRDYLIRNDSIIIIKPRYYKIESAGNGKFTIEFEY